MHSWSRLSHWWQGVTRYRDCIRGGGGGGIDYISFYRPSHRYESLRRVWQILHRGVCHTEGNNGYTICHQTCQMTQKSCHNKPYVWQAKRVRVNLPFQTSENGPGSLVLRCFYLFFYIIKLPIPQTRVLLMARGRKVLNLMRFGHVILSILIRFDCLSVELVWRMSRLLNRFCNSQYAMYGKMSSVQ